MISKRADSFPLVDKTAIAQAAIHGPVRRNNLRRSFMADADAETRLNLQFLSAPISPLNGPACVDLRESAWEGKPTRILLD